MAIPKYCGTERELVLEEENLQEKLREQAGVRAVIELFVEFRQKYPSLPIRG